MTWVREDHPLVVQHLEDVGRVCHGNDIYILRDDLIPAALGGNKVRIAAEFIADMRKQDADALVMYGDRKSNLCRVLALACHAERIPCMMITASETSETPAFNEQIISGLGVEILACGQGAIAEAVDEAMDTMSTRGYRPYYIYGNRLGTGNEGTAANAYAKVYRQLLDWEREHGFSFDTIVLPYGTGSTQGGLVAGSLIAQDNREIIGISISSRTPERAMSVLADTVNSWFEKQGLVCPEGYEKSLHLETRYNCGGYGVPNSRVSDIIATMLRDTAIPFDPVYSGKAFLGMQDYLREHSVTDKRILFIHTGGLPIFFDHLRAAQEEHAC